MFIDATKSKLKNELKQTLHLLEYHDDLCRAIVEVSACLDTTGYVTSFSDKIWNLLDNQKKAVWALAALSEKQLEVEQQIRTSGVVLP